MCESVRKGRIGRRNVMHGPALFLHSFSTPSDRRGDVVHIVGCAALLHGMCSVRWDWN